MILFVVSSKIYINLYINNIFSYLIYFYLGFLVCKYEDNLIKINKIAIIFITIILIILSLIFNNIYLNLGTAILTVLMFNIVMPSKTNNIIDKISTNSFGIYLLHSPLIYITYTYLSNARQISLIKECVSIIKQIEKANKEGVNVDLIEIDLKRLWDKLGEITGETYKDELLDEIFSKFCLGK